MPGFAILSSLCFGIAMVTGRAGLRELDSRAGAAVSIPTATLLFVLAAPFAFDPSGFSPAAALLFAVVGVFFPAIVTLLTFKANELLGPTTTSAVSGSAPLFALAAAGLFLGERIPPQAAVSALGVVIGVGLLSWKKEGMRANFSRRWLLWPLAGALVRGFSQAGVKAGLLLWPSPFSATLIAYLVSSATVLAADRMRGPRTRARTAKGVAWFIVTGMLNGCAMLSMYIALSRYPVWTVAPVVAAYPLVTAALGATVLHDEKMSLRIALGALITVAAIVLLVWRPGA